MEQTREQLHTDRFLKKKKKEIEIKEMQHTHTHARKQTDRHTHTFSHMTVLTNPVSRGQRVVVHWHF